MLKLQFKVIDYLYNKYENGKSHIDYFSILIPTFFLMCLVIFHVLMFLDTN